jgi:hypothetical protein
MATRNVEVSIPQKVNKETGAVEQEAWGTVVAYTPGDSLEEAKAIHGESNVYAVFVAKADIIVQDKARAMHRKGLSDAQIAEQLLPFKIGMRLSVQADPKTAYLNDLKAMTPEQRKEALRDLQKLAASL